MGSAIIILRVLDTLMSVVAFKPEATEAAQELVDQIRLMVNENRDPTDEEWAALNNKTIDLLTRLDSRG